MDRRTANKEWRDVTRGAPDGVPTGRTVHEFAQRVEALAIAGCDARHAAALAAQRELMLSMPNMMHACDLLGVPGDGTHCDILRRALYSA